MWLCCEFATAAFANEFLLLSEEVCVPLPHLMMECFTSISLAPFNESDESCVGAAPMPLVMPRQVLHSTHKLKVLKRVVSSIMVFMVDVIALWNWAVSILPNCTMQEFSCATEVVPEARETLPVIGDFVHFPFPLCDTAL